MVFKIKLKLKKGSVIQILLTYLILLMILSLILPILLISYLLNQKFNKSEKTFSIIKRIN